MIREGYTYDDLILEPKFSKIKSRQNVNLSVQLGPYSYQHPIIVANMRIVGEKMARSIVQEGGLAILHRFDEVFEQERIYNSIKKYENIGFSLGVNKESYENFWNLFELTRCNIWCVDVAHGHSELAINMVKFLKSHEDKIGYKPIVIAGNVATAEGARALWRAGADAVKIGVGEGSTCSTRIQ